MIKRIILFALVLSYSKSSFCQLNYSQKLNKLFNFYQKQNLFNGSVLVSKNGKVLLNKGYGVQNAVSSKLNSPKSIFAIYSITKTFTSTVILKLVEEKKMALTDKLSKFYPDYPKGDSITIENLLTHTSGIYDYTRGNDMKDQTEKSFVAFQKTKPLDFPVGSEWSYSNSGYYFLGYIIQKVTGMSYESAVAKYIFKPLKMKQSGFAFKDLKSQNKAIGYETFSDKIKKPSIVYDPPGPYAAGGIYSTVEDMYKYYIGLNAYKVLSKASLEKAYKPFKNNYGYGWVNLSMFDKNTVGHSGAGAGFRSNFIQIPEDSICVVLLSNTEKDLNNITGNVLKIFYDKTFKIPAEIKLTKEELKEYVGTYEVNKGFTIYVYFEDNKLISQPSGQPKSVLYPEKQNMFYVLELNDYIHFGKNNQNEIDTLIFNKNGQEIKAIKIYPSWEIMGSATKNGWEGLGSKLVETAVKNIWEIKNIELKKGEIKFRFNSDWTINLGLNSGDTLKQDGDNIKIENGNYSIILDLTDTENPKFKINKLK